MKKAVFIALCVCLCGVLIWILLKREGENYADSAIYPIKRQVRYSFTIRNTLNSPVKQADFWSYAPVKQTPTQKCTSIETSHPYQLTTDEVGNQILHFTFEVLPPFGSVIVTIKANLELSDVPNPWIVKDLQPFLKAERYMEIDDPELLKIAESFKETAQDKKAEEIFQWVAGNLQYSGFSGRDRGALYALKQKKGDCTEFMYLYAALCRANKIPSRCIGGYICPNNMILKPGGYHNWAEISVDKTWKNVDPQNKVFMQNPSHYIAMRVIGDTDGNPMGEYHRFRVEGEGLKTQMNK